MDRPTAQTNKTPIKAPTRVPTRAAIGGISLLMLVAFAVQASAGLMTPAMVGGHHAGMPAVRMLADAVTRRVDRQVRRQQERPALSRSLIVASGGVGAPLTPDRTGVDPVARRLLPMFTNLPPPAGDLA